MKYFDQIIGQEVAKRKLSFYIESYKATSRIPHLMFVSEKGTGKTMFAKVVAEALGKPYLILNCSSLKNIKNFFRDHIDKYFITKFSSNDNAIFEKCNQAVTIVFDEASELSKELTMSLLTILNPNEEGQNIFEFDGNKYIFDFSKHSFFFCTSEPQHVFHALMDRCERVDLEAYSTEDLGKILAKNIKVAVDKETLKAVSSVLRGNPRSAQKMSETINNVIKAFGLDHFDIQDWNTLKYTLGILPLGVTHTELQILKILYEETTVKLTHLAAKMGLTISSVQRHFEHFLIRNKLIKIQSGGRELTTLGRNYIDSLQNS